MFRRPDTEDLDHSARSSHNAMNLCRAIFEDTEDARQFAFTHRGIMELHSVMPCGPSEIRHGSAPLPSELTSLVA